LEVVGSNDGSNDGSRDGLNDGLASRNEAQAIRNENSRGLGVDRGEQAKPGGERRGRRKS